ncbi:MAG: NUDIX domain-containing protein [Candidatus Dormibacteraeota bacterium]|nr:NUDIX domain-containing protein [Candidatus Dormibacteraeota bacterium]
MSHYCVNCGSVLLTRVIEGREVEFCPKDNFVLWHDPKVTTAVVIEADGGVVLGRRAIEPGLGLWCLPGGFVNDDEDPWDAAARECAEEVCAAVELRRLIGVYHIRKQDAPSMIGIAYQARLAEGSRPSAGVEMLEVAVFQLESLPPLAFPSHRNVLLEYETALFPRRRARPDAKSPVPAEATGPRIAVEEAQRGRRPSQAQAPSRPRRRR